jgi:uncharacterized phage-associated protein
MNALSLTKTEQLLAYLIQRHPAVTITSLMKLSYIIDLISVQKTNKQISNFEYRRYKYGPFDQRIYTSLKDLLKKEIVVEDGVCISSGEEIIIFNFNENKLPDFNLLTQSEKEIIDEVLETLEGFGTKALTELTYKTKPMKKIGAKLGGERGLNKKLDLRAK